MYPCDMYVINVISSCRKSAYEVRRVVVSQVHNRDPFHSLHVAATTSRVFARSIQQRRTVYSCRAHISPAQDLLVRILHHDPHALVSIYRMRVVENRYAREEMGHQRRMK